MALTLKVNGQDRVFDALDEGASLAEAIAALGLKADRVAVERNGEIVSRGIWSTVRVESGDRLEVVHFVGGGSGMEGQEGCCSTRQGATVHNMCYRTLFWLSGLACGMG